MSNFFKIFAASPIPMRTNTPPRRDSYFRGDPIPVPDVIEDDQETSWALWAEAVAMQDDFYALTAPAPLTNPPRRMQGLGG
ncbi:MAG: hypothetical protein RIS34_1546 [Pseudomonadota bacterium]|jgi:hypothetical protein